MNEKQSGFKFVPVCLFIYSKDQGCRLKFKTILYYITNGMRIRKSMQVHDLGTFQSGVYFIMLKNKILFKNSKNGDHALLSSCTILAYYKHLNFVSSKSVIHFNKFRSYLSCLQFNFRYSQIIDGIIIQLFMKFSINNYE